MSGILGIGRVFEGLDVGPGVDVEVVVVKEGEASSCMMAEKGEDTSYSSAVVVVAGCTEKMASGDIRSAQIHAVVADTLENVASRK